MVVRFSDVKESVAGALFVVFVDLLTCSFCVDKVCRRKPHGSVQTRKPQQHWCVYDFEGTPKQFNNPSTQAKSQINALKFHSLLKTPQAQRFIAHCKTPCSLGNSVICTRSKNELVTSIRPQQRTLLPPVINPQRDWGAQQPFQRHLEECSPSPRGIAP